MSHGTQKSDFASATLVVVADEPPITVFTMGVNEWRTANTWPPENANLTKFYLRSADGSRHGTLSTEAPGDEPASEYDYDPDDPVPTLGGNHSGPQGPPGNLGVLFKRRRFEHQHVGPVPVRTLIQRTNPDYCLTGPISATHLVWF